LCFAIPGPFAAMGPFWALVSETQPSHALGVVCGTVNAFGNLGGFAGPFITGWLSKEYHNTIVAFYVLGGGMLGCAMLALILPRAAGNLGEKTA
jgi:ACS family tartrate transporter-like MFS transporter